MIFNSLGARRPWTSETTVLGVGKTEPPFDIASVFSNGEQGIWLDPNDLSTMFQDAAGTIPVAAAGQPVGLILDKSKGLALGVENVNPTAFLPANTTQTTVNNELSLTVTGTVPGSNQAVPTKIGATYLFTCKARADSSNTTPNAARIRIFGTNSLASVDGGGSTQTLKLIHTATAAYTTFQLQVASVTAFGKIGEKAHFSEVSVKELAGNHAYQTTSAARPILQDAPRRIDFDAVDDKLITNLPAQLSGCTVIRSVPNVGTQILTGQTIPATYEDNKDHCGLIVINRALTPSETSAITAEFNKRAGV